ncbi:transposase [Actinoplanes sp. CA-142083]|uniref:transposase n=1 Tax=Actinoplanes sp. CA-142083 TaxID=3239903 RepID=UPI003D8E47DA
MAGGKRVAARRAAWICFADECGQTLKPHKAATWAPKGVTPIAHVTATGNARVSVAGLVCYRPGHRSRLIYRTKTSGRGRKGEPKGFRERDFARLLDAAHRQLQAPIVLVWDGLSAHRSARMRALIAARPWLRVYRLPAYAPELNPIEKAWSGLKRSLANLPARTAGSLAIAVKNRLKRMQHRTHLIDGYLTGTGLSPPTPARP